MISELTLLSERLQLQDAIVVSLRMTSTEGALLQPIILSFIFIQNIFPIQHVSIFKTLRIVYRRSGNRGKSMTSMYIMTQEVMSHACSANLKLQKCILNNQTTLLNCRNVLKGVKAFNKFKKF